MTIDTLRTAPIRVRGLSFRYGRKHVLDNVTFHVPEGAFYALLGPNGAGKTTLMHVLTGIQRAYDGNAKVNGRECASLGVEDRQRMGYVAEGLKLPAWMTLQQLESYLAPFYPSWDPAHANHLRDRFELDSNAKIGKMSRGQYMKSALLCALAPRPKLLILDEPFTGMDVGVKDELVRGLLSASSGDGCTIVLSSHDIGELEMLADWVGFLDQQSMKVSEPLEQLHARMKHVDVVLPDATDRMALVSRNGLSVEQAGTHLKFVTTDAHGLTDDALEAKVRSHGFADALRVETRDVTLKEIFIALQRAKSANSQGTVAGV